MITYVDTSTLLKLVVEEDGSDRATLMWDTADALGSVALILVEVRATLAAATRARRLDDNQHRSAKKELKSLISHLHSIEVIEELIINAAELAETERLRGYDAVHLAAALFIEAPILTSTHEALLSAAGRRGLHVANPIDD